MMTGRQLQSAFWATYFVTGKPREFRGKSQNDLPADLRAAWADYVDHAARNGDISERTARSVTLE